MSYFDADGKEMLEVYLLETRQLLEQLEGHLLETEKKHAFSEEEIHAVFRIMHTIKGSSAMMGLGDLARAAHKLEDLFSYYRETYGVIHEADPELFDLLFTASDYIAKELEEMGKDSYQPHPALEVEAQADEYLRKARQEEVNQVSKPEEIEVSIEETKEEPKIEEENVPDRIPEVFNEKYGVIVKVTLEKGCKMENIRAFMLIRQISPLCSSVESFPPDLDKAQQGAEYVSKHGVIIRFESQDKNAVLEALKKGLFVAECQVLEDRTIVAVQPKEQPEEMQSEENKEAEFLNVRMDRLDRLQNLAGEMMIQMLTLDNELEQAGQEDIRENIAYQINRLVCDVERTVMEMRMVPVSSLVPKLRRIFRDVCRVQKKDVEFLVNCGDLEADKSVVEYVFEALMHLIRNAVDHGIESPQERANAGKEKKGKIIFNVKSTVGELILSIQDDGRGIDVEKVKATAKEKGLLVKREEEYGRAEILNMILHPGFTTKKAVTEFSGRGVGLDVVKNIMEEAGGHLYIDSEAGKGSKFTISVPLTLATIECIRFKVDEYRFSMPARYICQFLEYKDQKDKIQVLHGKTYLMLEDKMVPFIDLRHFYRLPGQTKDTAVLIQLNCNGKEACVAADDIYEQKRIVVKPAPALFGPGFRRSTGINGNSIMGNGSICSALDIEVLVDLYESEGTYGYGK